MKIYNKNGIEILFNVYWKHNKEEKSTTCFITNESGTELAQGKATAYAKDEFNKAVGRKVSLDRALYNTEGFDPTKEERTLLWVQVLDQAYLIKGEREKRRNEWRLLNSFLERIGQENLVPHNLGNKYEEVFAH